MGWDVESNGKFAISPSGKFYTKCCCGPAPVYCGTAGPTPECGAYQGFILAFATPCAGGPPVDFTGASASLIACICERAILEGPFFEAFFKYDGVCYSCFPNDFIWHYPLKHFLGAPCTNIADDLTGFEIVITAPVECFDSCAECEAS